MHRKVFSLSLLAFAGSVVWFACAAWALPPRCFDYPPSACPAEQGCEWRRDWETELRFMCKTFCGSLDPCSGTTYACCSWTWARYLKHGEDCTTPPLECWVVSDADETGGATCGLPPPTPYPCCHQHEDTCQGPGL